MFFNKDQISLLAADQLFNAIFMCDFGAGNISHLFFEATKWKQKLNNSKFQIFKRQFNFSGKSLIGKEKTIQFAEKEDLKTNPDPVFFISLVGVDEQGFVCTHEHIFDLYTKLYDFQGSNVKVISAQDLHNFYTSNHKMENGKKIDVYTMAEHFVEKHSNGHFVVDECPLPNRSGMWKI